MVLRAELHAPQFTYEALSPVPQKMPVLETGPPKRWLVTLGWGWVLTQSACCPYKRNFVSTEGRPREEAARRGPPARHRDRPWTCGHLTLRLLASKLWGRWIDGVLLGSPRRLMQMGPVRRQLYKSGTQLEQLRQERRDQPGWERRYRAQVHRPEEGE